MMDEDKLKERKVQEIYFLEQNLQNMILQKQNFQIGLSEINSALKELSNSGEDVFRIVGQLMLKSDKEKVKKELEKKKKDLDLRIQTIEKQEKILREHLEKNRKDVADSVKK